MLHDEVDIESNDPLQERIKKAAVFFSAKLESVIDTLKGYSIESDNKAVKKSFSEAFERFRKESFTKLSCLHASVTGFMLSEYLEAKAKSAIEIPPAKPHKAKFTDDTSGTILHPVLFQRLKEWRNIKADLENLPYYMIFHQKALLMLCNKLPQSMESLKRVKGIGKGKSEKYGKELLNIISSYCSENKTEPTVEPIPEEGSKKVKQDTKKVSFNLFREGKTILQISEERKLEVTTIESHLAHLVGTGEISVNEFVREDVVAMIAAEFDGNEDLRMGPVKAALGEEVTWSDLRFVMNHLKFMRDKLR
jgi:hypothetical protein